MKYEITDKIDKNVEELFSLLCLYLAFNPKDAQAYKNLHSYLTGWIDSHREALEILEI